MGGRGATSNRPEARPLQADASPVELTNERHGSSGWNWRHTILSAEETGDGGIELSYARPARHESPNRNTTIAHYRLRHGMWTGQPGDRRATSHGINWDAVRYVSGKTYEMRDFIRGMGFRWDSGSGRYERRA